MSALITARRMVVSKAAWRLFKAHQWVCDESAYTALVAQGYVTHLCETRRGVRWRLMVLPWEQAV